MQNSAQLPPAPLMPDNFSNLGHIFETNDLKPEYLLNACSILKPILQMAYLKLYIPLSMFTTTALDKIQFNDGLKFHKIIFGNGIGKHFLDISTFLQEHTFTETEFWQSYRNWLAVMDIIAEADIAKGWKLHHMHMMSEKKISIWFFTWQVGENMTGSCELGS